MENITGSKPLIYQSPHMPTTGDAIRQCVFGNHQGSLKWLATRPEDVAAFARNTLVDFDA